MSITNGYCTLAEIKHRMINAFSYSAATLSFAAGTKKISDSAYGLKRFVTGPNASSPTRLQISGSVSNNGYKTVATGGIAAEIVVNETLVDEAAGASVVITDVTNPIDDAVFESVVEAISRLIDERTGRRFFTTSEDETRYFTAENSDLLRIGDIVSLTSIKTDEDGDRVYERTWSATDYDLEPFNAALDGKPYSQIRTTPNGLYAFPTTRKGVQLVGKFGWSAAPKLAKEACLLQAERIFKRKDAPFGVLGSAEMGQSIVIPKFDPDVEQMLAPLVRLRIGGV